MFLKKSVFVRATFALLVCFSISTNGVAETVEPLFVGQPGDNALVEFSNSRSRVEGDQETVLFSMAGQLRHKVTSHEKGFVFNHGSYDITTEFADDAMRKAMAPLTEVISLTETNSVVTVGGELIELTGMEPILETLRSTVESLAEQMPEAARDAYLAQMNAITDEQAILESVQDDWSYLVAIWNGAELEKGFYYEGEFSEAVREFGGVDLPFEATYEYVGKVPCNNDDEELNCVELVFTSSLPAQVSEQITTNVQQNVSIPTPEDFVMAVNTTFTLRAEPENLRTHAYTSVRSVKTIAVDGSAWIEDIERKRYEFTYQ